jgi:prevent-host-death family protein
MALIKIADLKNNLSRHLAIVKQGGHITVLDRDRPIARIIPFSPADANTETADQAAAERMADLVRQGVVAPGDSAEASRWLAAHRPVRLPGGARGAVDTLVEMRRESTR